MSEHHNAAKEHALRDARRPLAEIVERERARIGVLRALRPLLRARKRTARLGATEHATVCGCTQIAEREETRS